MFVFLFSHSCYLVVVGVDGTVSDDDDEFGVVLLVAVVDAVVDPVTAVDEETKLVGSDDDEDGDDDEEVCNTGELDASDDEESAVDRDDGELGMNSTGIDFDFACSCSSICAACNGVTNKYKPTIQIFRATDKERDYSDSCSCW